MPLGSIRRAFLALLFAVLAACGSQGPAEPPTPHLLPAAPAPPPPPEEPVIARGIAAEDQTNVRERPDPASRVIGLVRRGARFDLVASEDVNGQTWWKIKGAGFIIGSEIRTRTDGEPTLGFIPYQPKLDQPMPYMMARVTARDGVPVYRRPPPRGEDPDRFRDRELREGYFFTVDKWVNIYDRQLYRGIRYWFVPREGTTPVTAPTFEGIEVTERTAVPFLWVTDPTAKLCPAPLGPSEGTGGCQPVERHRRLAYRGERRGAGGVWYETDDGKWIASLQVARVTRIASFPTGLRDGERWVHVDLRNQFAALYEGTQMVFVTLISSGDDQHPTPVGTFRLESKHVSATMDDEGNLSSPYFIQDVPWVQYFKGGYALHAAFWHDRFGLKTSHGCVNLAPADARRFFLFTQSPELPPGLHAVFTPPGRQGTMVHVTN